MRAVKSELNEKSTFHIWMIFVLLTVQPRVCNCLGHYHQWELDENWGPLPGTAYEPILTNLSSSFRSSKITVSQSPSMGSPVVRSFECSDKDVKGIDWHTDFQKPTTKGQTSHEHMGHLLKIQIIWRFLTSKWIQISGATGMRQVLQKAVF